MQHKKENISNPACKSAVADRQLSGVARQQLDTLVESPCASTYPRVTKQVTRSPSISTSSELRIAAVTPQTLRRLALLAALALSLVPAAQAIDIKPSLTDCGVSADAGGNFAMIDQSIECKSRLSPEAKALLHQLLKQETLDSETAYQENANWKRHLDELIHVVEGLQANAAAADASLEDKRAINQLLRTGDVTAVVSRLGKQAAKLQHAPSQATKAADLYRQQGALLRAQNSAQALAAYERALASEPDEFYTLWDAGDLAARAGQSKKALHYYQRMQGLAQAAHQANPQGQDWARILSVSDNKVGDMQVALGDTAAALRSYQAGLAIAKALTASEPHNTVWQGDLSVSEVNVGNMQADQGDTAGALRSYQAAFAINQTLTALDPHNTEWQRDLLFSGNKVGDMQAKQGDFAPALHSYQIGLAIAKTLTVSDPHNANWQRDLWLCNNKVGDIQVAQGDAGAALRSYQAGLVIAKALAASNPRNAKKQRDLLISDGKMGDILEALGDTTAALHNHQAGLAIAKVLAALDPYNMEWQRDVSVGEDRVGNLQAAQGETVAALHSYQADFAIAQKLAASDPHNMEWQRDLSISEAKVGDMQLAQGATDAALRGYQASLAITQKLAASDPNNSQWQEDIVVADAKIASLSSGVSPEVRRAALREGLGILKSLQRANKLTPARADWITKFESALRQLS